VGLLPVVFKAEAAEFVMPYGVQLWLRADRGIETEDGKVTVWEDQSPAQNHAVSESGGRPRSVPNAINGMPVVRFDGATTYLRVSHREELNTNSGLTVFVVYSHQSGFRLMQKKDNASGSQDDAWFVMPLGGLSVSGKLENGALFERGQMYHLQTDVYDVNRGQIGIYSNGMLVAEVADIMHQMSNSDDVYIGKRHRPGSTEGHLDGDIAEIIIFNRTLSQGEREKVERYLQEKYGFSKGAADEVKRPGPFPVVGHRDYPGTLPLLVGTEDGVGPLSLPVLDTYPLGSAYVFDSLQPDLFIRGSGGPYGGLYLFPWKRVDYGVPVFGVPILVQAPFKSNAAILQTDDRIIYGFYLDGQQLVRTAFDRQTFSFTEQARMTLKGLPTTPQNLAVKINTDGTVDVILEMPDGASLNPGGADRWESGFQPYDGAGIWRGDIPYRYLYVVTLASLFDKPIGDARLASSTQREIPLGIPNMAFVNLGEGSEQDLIVGTRFGNLVYYRNTVQDGVELTPQRYAVGADGNALRHPTIRPAVSAYPNGATGVSDLIVGGQGLIYYYRFTGDFTPNGRPIYDQPTPLLQEEAELYGGTLPVLNTVDWNGDGVSDLIVGNSEGRVLFFENVGSNDEPAFLPGVPVPAGGQEIHIQGGYRGSIQGIGESRWGYSCPAVFDWNSDGLPDIVMGDITGAYTVFINRGAPTNPILDVQRPIYCDGLELHGHWRVQPAIARLGERIGMVIIDGDGYLRLYWQIDDYNVQDGGRLLLDDGSPISTCYRYSGATGRAKLSFADWDGDGVLDLIIGTSRQNAIPNRETGFPQPAFGPSAVANVLYMKNVGTNERPVFRHPVPFEYKGEVLNPGGAHACGPTGTTLGGGGLNLLVGNERGRIMLYRRLDLSLFEAPIMRIKSPTETSVVSRTLVPDIIVESPVSDLRQITVKLGGQQVYSGTDLPADLSIDTLQFADGYHVLMVTAENEAGLTTEQTVRFQVSNWWRIIDDFRPPESSAWFGTVSCSQTSDESAGWTYAYTPDILFGDPNRKVRQDNSTEYLVWETTDLWEYHLELYSLVEEVEQVLGLAVSGDGATWLELDYAPIVTEQQDDWFHLEVKGVVTEETPVRFFRVVLYQSDIGADCVQLGLVRLRGTK